VTSVTVRSLDGLEWEEAAFGVRFAGRYADLARPMGATKLGFNLQELPPGKASVPYHTHYVNEELILVLEGEPTVRLESGYHALRPRDVVALPPGAAGAHQLVNHGSGLAVALLASTMIPHEYVEYFDSGKRAFGAGELAREKRREWLMLHEGQALTPGDLASYFLGERFDDPLDPAPAAAERDPKIVHLDDVPWESYATGPFRAERRRVGRVAGARLLGISVYRVAPGERMWPYHFHHVNEEMFLVLSGRARLRTPDGEREVGPREVVLCPPGAGGAHGFTALGDEPFEVFALSTMMHPEVSEYPDSGKVYVMVGSAPGGAGERALDLVVRKSDAVHYEDGES